MATRVMVIGTSGITSEPYFVLDGIVWYGAIIERAAHCGTLADFAIKVSNGKVRFVGNKDAAAIIRQGLWEAEQERQARSIAEGNLAGMLGES